MTVKVLFVCLANVQRSPTAEWLMRDEAGFEVRSVGITTNPELTRSDGTTCRPATQEDYEWADEIVTMEPVIKNAIPRAYWPKVQCVGIADRYNYKSPELVAVLRPTIEHRKRTGFWPNNGQCLYGGW